MLNRPVLAESGGSRTAASPRVVVVGGGLAGMAAAVALQSAGVGVTLLEARRMLGGRAGSFEDSASGEILDNCQHVLLGCCTNLLDFYRRLGVLNLIRFERAIHFIDGAGRQFDLWGVKGLSAPVHLGPALLRFGALTWGERLALSRAMLSMLRLGRSGRLALEGRSFGEWLDEHRQPASLVHKLYDPVLISALNEKTREVSASYAIKVFQDSLLAHSGGYPVGLPNCALSKLYADLPCEGVRMGARVAALTFDDAGRVSGVRLQSDELVPADAVVLATNYHTLTKWVPPERAAGDERLSQIASLVSVPILGVHLWFDRPILNTSHAALIEGPLQWLFRKEGDGSALHGVISAARDFTDCDKEKCLKEFEAQVRGTLPAAREARLLRGVIVVEKRATFSVLPGMDRYRPNQAPPASGVGNLFLAGDYTRTGWPATMEGAVRSGYLAAEAVVRQLLPERSNGRFIVPDLPLQWPARLIRARA